MKFVFVRHAEGEHTMRLPHSLLLQDPSLTKRGRAQAGGIKHELNVVKEETILISPTRRTLQTAVILADSLACNLVVHPALGPRMFPLKQGKQTLPCDQILERSIIKRDFPTVHIAEVENKRSWSEGINTISQAQFDAQAKAFLEWCEEWAKHRVILVSHDGTITAYRQFMCQEQLSREDFLTDAGWIEVTWKSG
ncbi:phosphoglycerate mutase family [Bacillus sp. JCM 19046]|uniref:Broad specificity phosphatase PhoE n=1 Tax=Shouchella xiaoxiensis TaxID=766895 RepID=A0ABS2SMS6_9BACI|nr:histidine phosphatase family protein [Shouchella xiaoxiensis]MBM7836827.1 broad specificity phosphatase PhoE [Shouchella xiaoxiensis]GAF10997.1 phosphoglycerate mutase family [Bacillus sp. JCM 19045]GAF17605.1 phosphoglycerate mutase family [Bacillus sp. JCM 19046]